MAWWKLDETDGATAADASGHKLAARIQGSPRWTSGQGPRGGALELDGAQDYLACEGAPEFDFRDRMAVSLWLKPGKLEKKSQTLVAKGDTWRMSCNGDSQVVFSVTGPERTGKDKSKAPQVTSKANLKPGQWQHLVACYDGKQMALYVNGVLDSSLQAAGVLGLNTEPVWLGNYPGSSKQYFSGALSDVRLYDCSLSEQEIKGLSNSGSK